MLFIFLLVIIQSCLQIIFVNAKLKQLSVPSTDQSNAHCSPWLEVWHIRSTSKVSLMQAPKSVHLPSASSTLCQLQVTNSHKFHLPPTIAQVLHQPPMLMERSESAKSNFHAKTELWSMPVRGVPCMNLSLSLTHTHTHTVQNAFWGVVTNPNGQCPVLGAPAGLNPPIWQITPWSQVFCT